MTMIGRRRRAAEKAKRAEEATEVEETEEPAEPEEAAAESEDDAAGDDADRTGAEAAEDEPGDADEPEDDEPAETAGEEPERAPTDDEDADEDDEPAEATAKKVKVAKKKAEISAEKPTGGRRAGFQVLVVLGLVTVALAAAVVWLFLEKRALAGDDTARRQAAFAASQAAEDLSSYDYRTLDSDLRRATGHTTGKFRREFEAQIAGVKASATQQRAVVEGTSIKTAVESVSDRQVVALVFLNQQTAKAGSAERLPSQYTLRLTMNEVDGKWLVSKLELL